MSENNADFSFIKAMIPVTDEFCNSIPGGFFIYKNDETQELLYVNKAMLRIFGCETEEELRRHVNNSFKGMVHPDDYEKVTGSINAQVEDNPYGLDFVEYRITRKDGSVCWVEDYGRLTESETYGKIFYVFIEDATDRRKSRIAELQKVNNRLNEAYARELQFKQAILHNSVTFFEVDLTNDRFIDPHKISISQQASDLYNPDDFTKYEKFSDFIAAYTEYMDDKDGADYRNFFSIPQVIRRYKHGDLEQNFETSIIDASGRKRQLLYTLFVGRNDFTSSIITLVVVRDLTEKSVKQKLFMTALSKANAKNVANQNFITNISNHIFTPLNSIKCFTGLINNNYSNADMIKYCVDRIDACCDDLLQMLDQYSKIDEVAVDLSLECDLNDMLSDIRSRLQIDINDKHILFNIDKKGVKNFKVYADAIRLEEILWQLLDNAVKFTSRGGVIMLKVTETDISEPDGKKRYSFEVYNSGDGVDEDTLADIVELFRRPPSDDEDIISGSRMGLVLVKSFLDKMGGSITVDSKPGQGSTFAFTIPFAAIK